MSSAAPTQDCTVVIPTYNECDNIRDIIAEVLVHSRFRVLVVDDNSPDGTGKIVAEMALEDERVGLLSRAGKLGLGTAYIEGFRRCLDEGASFIFEMDADFSHDPKYLPQLLAKAEEGCDVVLGSRWVPEGGTRAWGLGRQILSRGGNVYANTILRLPTRDSTGGFRCYRRAVLEKLELSRVRSNGYAFQIEMVFRAVRAGFTTGEIPIIFHDRRVGQTKMSNAIVIEAIVNVWRLRFGLI